MRRRSLAGLAVAVLVCVSPARALDPTLRCEKAAATSLRACVKKVNAALRGCYLDTGAPCTAADTRIAKALESVQTKVLRRCPDATTVQAAGYGALMTPSDLVARLQEACRGEPAALAARAFGGPHAAVLAGADAAQRDCIEAAHRAGARLLHAAFKLQSTCVRKTRAGRACDSAATEDEVTAEVDAAVSEIAASCPALEDLVAVGATEFAAPAAAQVRCMLATVHPDPAPLALDCGPRPAAPVPARGVTTQVVLDEATWGTRCGDGSPYAFRVRLAPAGGPVERVVIHLQGGGVCLGESDCGAVSPGLFEALGDAMPSGGYFSDSTTTNPTFANWTRVFLPYCTQDVHIGGGGTSTFPSLTVHRFGAVNARAALRYVRDVLWAELDATSPEGFRPDRLQVVFSGTSAGGFGTSYNYHYVLDDLRWSHTIAVPDGGLGLDNGEPFGMGVFGYFLLSPSWASRPFLPPYCATQPCAVVPVLHEATVPRLRATPEQQILHLSNQVDNTQVYYTLFANLPSFITALRTTYCAEQGMNGLRFFLASSTSNIHGILTSSSRFSSLSSAGVTVRDWLTGAVTDPDAVADAVSEGSLATLYGIAPFACPVGP